MCYALYQINWVWSWFSHSLITWPTVQQIKSSAHYLNSRCSSFFIGHLETWMNGKKGQCGEFHKEIVWYIFFFGLNLPEWLIISGQFDLKPSFIIGQKYDSIEITSIDGIFFLAFFSLPRAFFYRFGCFVLKQKLFEKSQWTDAFISTFFIFYLFCKHSHRNWFTWIKDKYYATLNIAEQITHLKILKCTTCVWQILFLIEHTHNVLRRREMKKTNDAVINFFFPSLNPINFWYLFCCN